MNGHAVTGVTVSPAGKAAGFRAARPRPGRRRHRGQRPARSTRSSRRGRLAAQRGGAGDPAGRARRPGDDPAAGAAGEARSARPRADAGGAADAARRPACRQLARCRHPRLHRGRGAGDGPHLHHRPGGAGQGLGGHPAAAVALRIFRTVPVDPARQRPGRGADSKAARFRIQPIATAPPRRRPGRRGRGSANNFVTEIFRARTIDAAAAVEALRPLVSREGSVTASAQLDRRRRFRRQCRAASASAAPASTATVASRRIVALGMPARARSRPRSTR